MSSSFSVFLMRTTLAWFGSVRKAWAMAISMASLSLLPYKGRRAMRKDLAVMQLVYAEEKSILFTKR